MLKCRIKNMIDAYDTYCAVMHDRDCPTLLKLICLEKPVVSSTVQFWKEKIDGKEFPVMLQITKEELEIIYGALELREKIKNIK
jgi:hypothetical protein